MKSYYVIVFQAWDQKRQQWTWHVGAEPVESTARPIFTERVVGIYIVDGAHSRRSAKAILTTWLAKGKPSIMTVEELTR